MARLATHDPDNRVNVVRVATPAPSSFATMLLLCSGTANSLDGDRTVSYASVAAAEADQDAGFISTQVLAQVTAAFAQRGPNGAIAAVLVGRVDDSAGSAATKAFKAFGGAGLGDGLDTVIEAHTAGVAGNLIAVQLVGDSAGAVAITSSALGTVTVVKISYQPGSSTVTDVESAITALAGAADLIDVKTGGTGATVLDADAGEMLPTLLAGGAAAVATETYAQGLAACIDDDDAFYGVILDSRDSADVLSALGYLTSQAADPTGKRMVLVAQESDADWLVDGGPAAYASYIDSTSGNADRLALVWHDDDAEGLDAAWIANRLNFDLDVRAPGWNAAAVLGVAAYATLTPAERAFAVANRANLMLAYGTTSSFVVKPGEALAGFAFEEVVTEDWAVVRIRERVADMQVARAAEGLRVPMSAEGQALMLEQIEAVLQAGEVVGHFVPGQTSATAETITSADRTARRLRFTVRAQLAISANLMTTTVYLSTDPINAVAAA